MSTEHRSQKHPASPHAQRSGSTATPEKLVLFDIDGTLLNMGPINRHVLIEALEAVYGTAGDAATCSFAGRMDNAIIHDILRETGLHEQEIAERFEQAKATYILYLQQQSTPHDVTLLTGIRELLEQLSADSRLFLGLLTGNFEESGWFKLRLPGIEHYFRFGAFAEDGSIRNDLPPVAIEKASRLCGKLFHPSDVVIIGDTGHDIRCAQAIHARSIAIATGTVSRQELQQYQPDVLLDDLARIDLVIDRIMNSQNS